MLRLITDGLHPQRAASLANLPATTLDNPRIADVIYRAEAALQRRWLRTIEAAGNDQLRREYAWERLPEDQQAPIAELADSARSPAASGKGSRAPTRAWQRTWTKQGDWHAVTFLAERRFPAEYGQQQPQQVASAVVDVLHALAALRGQPATLAVHRPQQLAAGEQQAAPPGTS